MRGQWRHFRCFESVTAKPGFSNSKLALCVSLAHSTHSLTHSLSHSSDREEIARLERALAARESALTEAQDEIEALTEACSSWDCVVSLVAKFKPIYY